MHPRWMGRAAVLVALATGGPALAVQDAGGLATNYRFVEYYGPNARPGMIGQYRVGIREELGLSEGDTPTPAGRESAGRVVRQVICVERAAEFGGLGGGVRGLVRRYERAQASPGPGQPPAPLGLEGLAVWCRVQPDGSDQILCLTEGRSLGDADFRTAADQLFTPDLASLLPFTPVRIGDEWPLPKTALRTLIGNDQVVDGRLTGTLREVRAAPDGGGRVALIDLGGRVTIRGGAAEVEVALRGEAHFRFPGPAAGEADGSSVLARGGITRLSLGQAGSIRSAEGDQVRRLDRELVLERQLDNSGAPLEIPVSPPEPTMENSWLSYVDPSGRFRFRHPQELRRPEMLGMPAPESADRVDLVQPRPGGGVDLVRLEVRPQGLVRPETFESTRLDDWKDGGVEVVKGASGWLPESEWPGLRAYRFEAAVPAGGRNAPPGTPRIHVYGYVVHFGRNASLTAEVMTVQDPPAPFRDAAEAMLKTFTWDP